MGAKKFGMSLETREIKFCRDIPGFCWDIPAVPEKFEKKMFVFNFGPKLICYAVADQESKPIKHNGQNSYSRVRLESVELLFLHGPTMLDRRLFLDEV